METSELMELYSAQDDALFAKSQLESLKSKHEKELRKAVSYGIRNALIAYRYENLLYSLDWDKHNEIVESFIKQLGDE
jgi:hypothetical protein